MPVASGIPAEMSANVIVLDYGDAAALETIRAHAHELAAVLVEPVQSRRPEFQPREFLHSLRDVTACRAKSRRLSGISSAAAASST